MQLSDEVKAALERYRQGDIAIEDMGAICDEMLVKFPPNYHDEITPERLVEAGFQIRDGFHCAEMPVTDVSKAWLSHNLATGSWRLPSRRFAPPELIPRNMGEVLELVARCKEGM